VSRSPLALLIFGLVLALTVGITIWAGRRKIDAGGLYVAHGQLTGWQNGLAIVGDLLSASVLLGTVGIVALRGIYGLFFVVGPFVAFLLLLLVLAEPLRNLGRYTVADAVAARFRARNVRVAMAINSLLVTLFYMLGQLVAAGSLLSAMLGVDYRLAVVGVGALMTLYIVVGGMLATSWIQIVKAVLLLGCIVALVILLLVRFDFNALALFSAAGKASHADLFAYPPGTKSGLNLLSMSVAVVLGTAALPHILVRFLTVPNAREARKSLNIALALIGPAMAAIPFIGLGAAALIGPDAITKANVAGNLATLQLSALLGGDLLYAIVAAVAFATILAVVAGLLIAGSGVLAHDVYNAILRNGEASEREQVRAGRVAAIAISIVAIGISIAAHNSNVAVLGVLAVVVAASANVPILLLLLFWPRFNGRGVIAGAAAGLLSAVGLILIGPQVMGKAAIFPLDYPSLVSVPLGFLGCWLGTVSARSSARSDDAPYDEIRERIAFGSYAVERPAA
jgi:cation/acetate symporter